MKKSILNIGKALNKAEQKEINGGYQRECSTSNGPDEECPPTYHCDNRYVCVPNRY